MLDGTAAWFGCGHQRLQMVPFGVGKVGIVAIAGFHPASLRDTFSNALLVSRLALPPAARQVKRSLTWRVYHCIKLHDRRTPIRLSSGARKIETLCQTINPTKQPWQFKSPAGAGLRFRANRKPRIPKGLFIPARVAIARQVPQDAAHAFRPKVIERP